MILLKTLHPNRWFLYFILVAFAILLVVYYAAQTYLIEEDTRYFDQPVGVTGTTPAHNADDVVNTAGWKTYRNEEYGFMFKYPEAYEFEQEAIDDTKEGLPVKGVSIFLQTDEKTVGYDLSMDIILITTPGFNLFQKIVDDEVNQAGFWDHCDSKILLGKTAYDCKPDSGPFIGEREVLFRLEQNKVLSVTIDPGNDRSSEVILSSLTFFEPKK
ncbi:MAG: hypothetical protein AAB417_01005 [Patescibacteria group bacterium]